MEGAIHRPVQALATDVAGAFLLLAGLIDFSAPLGRLVGHVGFGFDHLARPPFGVPIPFSALAGKHGPAASTEGAQALRPQAPARELGSFVLDTHAAVVVGLAGSAIDR
jgi:hypothetical protein